MAKLSAKNRVEIGRIELLTKTEAYFTNGDVLVNYGDGWKVKGKIKAGLDPKQAYNHLLAQDNQLKVNRPHFANYRKELINTAHSKRGRLHYAIKDNPNDPDSVWSDCCDSYGDNINATMEDINRLCHLYKLTVMESEEIRAAKEAN